MFLKQDNKEQSQEKWVSEFQNSFYKEKKVSIIDDNLRGLSKAASSIEGLEAILSSVVRNKNNFDCIIIDYFHKINESKENPTQSEIEVLTNVCNMLDRYRKLLPCAVVLFAQLHPSSAERDDFESRIKGRRKIFEPATFVAEIIPNRDTKITTFKIEKNRFENSTVGQQIQIGFDTRTGRFRILNDPLFAHQLETNKNNIQKIIEDELKTEKSKKGKTK